jgi:predicted AAA+ superfamily ATPase
MALSSGQEISYQSLAGDCGVSPNSIKNYIQVLEDTLVAFQLKAFTKTHKRKAISRSKLYLFDIGVTNSLANRGEILEGSELFGNAFEHFIIQEVRAFLSYTRKKTKMYYWRSTSRFEVDLILDNQWAIEIKGTASIQDKHLKGIRALKEEGNIQNLAVVSCDRYERETKDNITIFPWKIFLENLWNGNII